MTTSRSTPDDLREMLRAVIDPELGSDIVELGMVRDITVDDDGHAVVSVALTTAGCPLRGQIQRDVRNRITSAPGISSVKVDWGEMTQEEKSRAMSKARFNVAQLPEDTSVPSETQILLIASGKGGVGKSSVTANLAAALASRGMKIGVLDADVWGFSIPRMLGVSGRMSGRSEGEKKEMEPIERRIGDGVVRVVSMGFLVEDESSALMWRGLMLNRGVQHFLQDVSWGDDLDYLLVDMPPGTGDVQMGVAKTVPRSQVIVVTTPAVAAQKVASRAVSMSRKSFLRVAGVIENMSAFTCEHGTSHALFGSGGGEALAEEAGVPLLGQIPIENSVAEGGDVGQPAALGDGPAAEAFAQIAERVTEEILPEPQMLGCTTRIFDTAAARNAGAGDEQISEDEAEAARA